MRKIIKIFIVFFIFCMTCFFIQSANVSASSTVPTKTDTLSIMNTSINITKGMYDDYTDSEEEISWANFYGVKLYNYHQEDYGFCGFYMDYTKKPNLLGLLKGKATIHGDDPIIYLVPKELFVHRGCYTYVGKEYGFFVNTTAYSDSGELETANLVDVFMFDIITSYNNSTEMFTYTIKPLYTFTYIYLSDYLFYEYNEVTIDSVNISLDSENYSTYSDAVIPLPRMNDEKVSNQYGATYMQNYDETQPNKDLYAIKDTTAFINLTNANSKNSFDSDYDIEKDNGYRIRRSYVQFNGYSAILPNVSFSNLIGVGVETAANVVGIFSKKFAVAYTIVSAITGVLTERNNIQNSSKIGYEMKTLSNNPSDMDKGGKAEQRTWYKTKGYEEQYWKTDAKQIKSSSNNALIFKTLTYDILDFPVYNSITYYWNLESESKEKAYLTYGSEIEIAKLNPDNNSYNGISVGKSEYYKVIGNEIFKEVTILSNQRGYMLKNGIYDVFSFEPEYSGYYNFNAPSYSTINLYENNQLIKTENGNLSYIFDQNKMYKFEVVIGSFPQNSRQYNVSIEPVKLIDTGTYQLDNYIKNDYNTGLIKIYSDNDNIYNLEMYSLNNNTKIPLNFSVYDSDMNIVQKFLVQNYQNLAETTNGTGSMTINFEKEKYYYILFDTDYYSSLYIEWNYLNNEYDFDIIYSSTTDIGDKFTIIDIPYTSKYEIIFNFSNTGLLSNNTAFALFKYNSDNELSIEFFTICSNSSGEIIKEINLQQNDKIYFGYFNGVDFINYTFIIVEKPLYEFTITTETNSATAETGLGTEVTVNNGLRYNNTIAVGFTRVLYLGSDANFSSRYNDYTWSSSNASIATVSAYGTVFAKSEGTVTIRVVDKYGQNNVASIELVIYVKQTETTLIQLSTDVNEDYTLNGTEVTKNGGLPGGTTISVGYTRSVCIISGGPTNIRQDYNWTSSNNNIATVDKYGIIHAIKPGVVVITCTNKYNSSYIGTITITVL